MAQHAASAPFSVLRARSHAVTVSRRAALVAVVLLPRLQKEEAHASSLIVENDEPGSGAEAGDAQLALVHYTGKLVSTGQVFDSTRGGLPTRINGLATFSLQPAPSVPRVVSLSPSLRSSQPGICAGLAGALVGMKAGGKRTVSFGPELGFGNTQVGAPYGVVPAGSSLRYEVELLRVSSSPDELFKDVAFCGVGGAGAQNAGCDAIASSK